MRPSIYWASDRIERGRQLNTMQLPFRIQIVRRVEVHISVSLDFESARLGDLVQILARSAVLITDLIPDRSLYHLGLPERFVQITFLAKDLMHKQRVLERLSVSGYETREMVH